MDVRSLAYLNLTNLEGHLHNLAEIEREAVGFPVICHLMAREFTSGGSILFF